MTLPPSTGGGGGSSDNPIVDLSAQSLQQITQLLQQANQYVVSTVNDRLVQLNTSIASMLTNTTNAVLSRINQVSGQTNNLIVSTTNSVLNAISYIPQSINGVLIQSEQRVQGAIQNSTNNINSNLAQTRQQLLSAISASGGATEDEIRAQTAAIQQLAIMLVTAINNSSINLSEEMKDAIDNSELITLFRERIPIPTDTSELPSIGDTIEFIMRLMGITHNDDTDNWLGAFNGMFTKLSQNRYNNLQELYDDIKSSFGGNVLFSSIINGLLFMSTLMQLIHSFGQPFANNVLKLVGTVAQPSELDPQTLLYLNRMRIISDDDIFDRFTELGYKPRNADDLYKSQFHTLLENQVRMLWQRGLLNEQELQSFGRKLGYDDYHWSKAKQTWEYYPTPPDIVAFANRDVFEPDVIAEFGLDQELSQDYLELSRKAGLSEDFAKMYWYAHWYLPSNTQGQEMLHRGVITPEQLDKLYKAQDIVPFWREKLTEISYTPLVRVDVRRIHKMGIISDADLVQSYKNTGYNQQDAEIMAQWTRAYNGMGGDDGFIDTKALTRSLVVRAYTNGLFTYEIAVEKLMELGHSPEDSNIILELANLEDYINAIPKQQQDNADKIEKIVGYGVINGLISENSARDEFMSLGMDETTANNEIAFLQWEKYVSIRELLVKNLKNKYCKFIVSANDVMNGLRNNGFNTDEINDLLTQWDIIRDDRDNLPTKAELEDMLLGGVIDIDLWVNYMRGLGYSDIIIEHYFNLLSGG